MESWKNTVIYGVMVEELERNQRMRDRYLLELESLPKGSIVMGEIEKRQHLERVLRDLKVEENQIRKILND